MAVVSGIHINSSVLKTKSRECCGDYLVCDSCTDLMSGSASLSAMAISKMQ